MIAVRNQEEKEGPRSEAIILRLVGECFLSPALVRLDRNRNMKRPRKQAERGEKLLAPIVRTYILEKKLVVQTCS